MAANTIARFVLVLLLFGGAFSSAYAAREKLRRHVVAEEGFEIGIPDSWEVKKDHMGTALVALSPADAAGDTFRENFNVVVEPLSERMSVAEYFERNLSSMKGFFVDFRYDEPDSIVLDGHDALRLRYSHTVEGLKLKVTVYLLVKGHRGFVLTATALPGTVARYKRTFEAIARTFRLRR